MTASHRRLAFAIGIITAGCRRGRETNRAARIGVVIALGWQSGWRSAPLFSRALRLTICSLAWMGGRAVEGTGLENRQGLAPLVGSNPTPSATFASNELSLRDVFNDPSHCPQSYPRTRRAPRSPLVSPCGKHSTLPRDGGMLRA